MATSKTLAPTNVTISIPAMTDQPDASVFSNCVDKEADAINALNSQMTNYLKSGTNNIGNIIVPGYNTGSGNYIDCFVPCSTGGKTVTAASASSSTLVYLPTKRITFSSAPTITVLETNAYGVRLEIAYPSTETANITGTVYLVNLVLTCS